MVTIFYFYLYFNFVTLGFFLESQGQWQGPWDRIGAHPPSRELVQGFCCWVGSWADGQDTVQFPDQILEHLCHTGHGSMLPEGRAGIDRGFEAFLGLEDYSLNSPLHSPLGTQPSSSLPWTRAALNQRHNVSHLERAAHQASAKPPDIPP